MEPQDAGPGLDAAPERGVAREPEPVAARVVAPALVRELALVVVPAQAVARGVDAVPVEAWAVDVELAVG